MEEGDLRQEPNHISVRLSLITLMLCILSQSAWAHSLSYHLERIALQSEALQNQLTALQEPTWGQQTAGDDLRRLRASSEAFAEALANNPLQVNEALQFLVQLEVAAARVRTSQEIAGFSPEQQLRFDELQVEVKEVRRSLESQRQSAERQRAAQTAPRVSFGIGFGTPYWGGYPGFYRPFYRPVYRPVYRRNCRRR